MLSTSDISQIRPWPVKALMFLLFLQTAALVSIGAYNLLGIDLNESAMAAPQILFGMMYTVVTDTGIFGVFALVALFAAVGFWRLWRNAWIYAMLVQSFTLLLALINYFIQIRPYTYPLMIYAIFMVIYLQHPDVQAAFQVTPVIEEQEEGI